MKKLLLSLTLALFAASCSDDSDIIVVKEGPSITLNVSPMAYALPDATGGGTFEISGSLTDFGLYEFDQTKQIFTNTNRHFTTSSEGGYSAASQTSAGWSKNAKTFYAYAPYSVTAASVTALDFTIPANVTQNSENPEAHILSNNLLVATAEVAAGATVETLTFTPAASLIDFKVTNDTSGEITVSQITYSANQELFYTTGSYNFREQTCAASEATATLSVTLNAPMKLAAGEKADIYLPLVPTTIAKGTELTLAITTDRGAATIVNVVNAAEGQTFEGGKAYIQEVSISDEYFVEILPAGQNSYIVKPAEDGGETYFMLPVTRVNEYWGGEVSNADNQIYDDTKWVAEIIWKDFDAENKTLVMTEGKNVGTGTLDKIGFTLYANAADQWGNAVIGIKKADDNGNPVGDYLWSWHIWVSDVDATAEGTNVNSSRDAKFMDRYLGAKSVKKEDGVLTQGLLYQWGRKDPFIGKEATTAYAWPTPVKFLDVFTTETQGQPAISYAVQHPTTFILRSPESWAWMNYKQLATNDITYKAWVGDKKTIYDPCPKGWRMPFQQSYGEGTANMTASLGTSANMSNWTWDATYKGYTVNGIWFSAQEGRNGRTGAYGPDTTGAGSDYTTIDELTLKGTVVWTAQGSALSNGYWGAPSMSLARVLYFTSDGKIIQPQLRGPGRASAHPVRCIRYTAED